MALVLRRNKGSVLTKDEVDDNFVFLNTGISSLVSSKQDKSANLSALSLVVGATNTLAYFSSSTAMSAISFLPFSQALLGLADANAWKGSAGLDLRIGLSNGLATLGADGKLPPSLLPPLAVNESFIVNSQAEMLALTAERGDMAFRTDQANTPYVLTADAPAVLANWKSLDKTMSASLAALNVLTPALDQVPYYTGTATAGLLAAGAAGKASLAAVDATAGRAAIAAAKSGANSDITSVTGLTTALSLSQGGTGKTTEFRKNHIAGLTLTYNSAQSITISEGSAYIPSSATIIELLAPITLTAMTLTASTFYHVYLYDNAGVTAVEFSSTAPVAYVGGGYNKTGDTTRRYVGPILSGSANALWPFTHSPQNLIQYAASITSAPFALSSAAVNGPVRVSCTAVVPVTGYRLLALFSNNATDTAAYFIDPSVGANVMSRYDIYADKLASVFSEIGLNSNREYEWSNRAAANGVTGVYARGYYFKR